MIHTRPTPRSTQPSSTHEFVRSLGVPDMPPRTSPFDPGYDKSLPQREQDIALLVCQDLSNKLIADRLYLSPKTVETHLTRVFAKLNVSARGDLKGLLDATD